MKSSTDYCLITSRVMLNEISGLVRSLEYIVTCFSICPFLLVVSTVAFIWPTAPGSRWSELTTAAVQPQVGWTRSITRVSLPTLLISNTWEACVP
jgi:hypothetical protein